MVWTLLLGILLELLIRFYLHELPYKFLNHTNGPIRRLGQYSKNDVIPKDYIAIVGDSHAYGFGPWLYDNSWSWGQPEFATHHLLHSKTNVDVLSFGYPGFGSLGSCLTSVSEYKFISESAFWPELAAPKIILLFFYEGNDLINNLHEIEQRGFDITRISNDKAKEEIGILLKSEALKIDSHWSWFDHLASWNLFSGLFENYSRRFQTTEPDDHPTNIDHSRPRLEADDNQSKRTENIALINGQEIDLGYSEGPALLLTDQEVSLSMEVFRQSLAYMKKNLPSSRIAVVYLPSSLSIYQFESQHLRPAPLVMKGERRDRPFAPAKATENSLKLRNSVGTITNSLGLKFIDPTDSLQDSAKQTLLHGPRDPIHFNREGYLAFAEAILPQVKVLCQAAVVKPASNSTN